VLIKGQLAPRIDRTSIDREEDVQLEDHGLVLFIRFCHDLFCELDDGLKVGIMFVLRLSQITQKSIARSPTQGVAESRSPREKGTKMLTFGAKGFVLESAMTDDDDEMRVARGERIGQRESPHRVCTNLGSTRTGHRTPPLTPALPSGSLY